MATYKKEKKKNKTKKDSLQAKSGVQAIGWPQGVVEPLL
jgi:hypothetical protein